jgi:hypothetical protein
MQEMILGRTRLERIGTGALAAATVIAGTSIVLGDAPGRFLNGVGGLTWFASAAMLAVEGRRRGAPGTQWAAVGALTAAVAFVIRPSDLTLASVGFGAAGLLSGLIARNDVMLWAKMIPALYLPMHIGTAILKAAGRSLLGMEASIRTEPPPTAAIVPAVMLVAAVAGGWVAGRIKASRLGASKRLGSLAGER